MLVLSWLRLLMEAVLLLQRGPDESMVEVELTV